MGSKNDCNLSNEIRCKEINERKPKLSASAAELNRFLDVIEFDILPKTRLGVLSEGNKVFGAAVLNQENELVVADTNHETECPLYHGEIYVIKKWSEKIAPKDRGPAASSSIFISTHEPCCMCISSIVWSGFQKVFYLFPYETTAQQGIPHDIRIMHELWQVPSYNRQNAFLSTACLIDLVEQLLPLGDQDIDNLNITNNNKNKNSDKNSIEKSDIKAALKSRIADISCEYDKLSKQYHTEKISNENNSLAFD